MGFLGYLCLIIALSIFFALNHLIPIGLLLRARQSGLAINPIDLLGMRLRGVPPHAVVEPAIAAARNGLEVSLHALEAHHLAGGNAGKVVAALISARRAGFSLDLKQASAIDLAGQDVSGSRNAPFPRRLP
ncbi:MAG TPA: flotillin-like FloA family protein [Candidatus Ozemobacteraceae bacterium]|nr:flotillin-like FloA family protein [Candidatus Ozemobacteraceae bacterium]